jgi:outer membrane receptor protein involved in Fe transport
MNSFNRIAYGCVIAIAWAAPALAQSDADPANDEIIVTATKRETTLQDTPIAVSVLGGDAIDKRNIVGMDDYLQSLPGVSYQDRGAGSNTITIRGIGLGSQLDPNSPVGSYFGEVPVTGLGPATNGNQGGNADVKMVDVARVEVLRGPQGTLYGSGTMGGTVRIIPNAPNLKETQGSVRAELSSTARLGGRNYSIEAMVNAPLIEDKLALRMVAYRFDNDGYIDNVAVTNPTPRVTAAAALGALREDRKHVGGDTYTGFRGTLLWKPVPDLSITAMHLNQKIEQDGFKEVQLSLPGRYQQSRMKVGDSGMDNEFVDMDLSISNLVVEYDLGWGSLLNSTSKINSEATSDVELTFFGPPFLGEGSLRHIEKKIFINEFRFASKFEGPIQLLAGLYYEDRKVDQEGSIRWAAPPPIAPGGFFQSDVRRNTQKQFAAFGEVSFNPFEPFTITGGARYFKFKQAIPLSRVIGQGGGSGAAGTEGDKASVSGVNFKVNASYKFSDELFLYGQWTQGFREPRFQTEILPEFDMDNDGLVEFQDGIERKVTEGLLDPDSVENYELGIKYQSSDRRLRGALTAFMIDWTGIPVVPSLTAYLGSGLYFNVGKARSKGLEFEFSAEPIEDLIFDVSASWISSKLAEGAPGLGDKGDDLPGVADYNVHAALEKRFTIGDHDAFIRGDYTYVSGYYGTFAELGQQAGNYHVFDMSAGVTIDNFRVGLFAKNLTNRADFTWIDNVFGSDRAYRLRPRTIGVNVGVVF